MDQFLPASVSKLWEYGGLVSLSVSLNCALGYIVYYLIKRLANQADRYIETIQAHTSLLSKIATQIDGIANDKD